MEEVVMQTAPPVLKVMPKCIHCGERDGFIFADLMDGKGRGPTCYECYKKVEDAQKAAQRREDLKAVLKESGFELVKKHD